MSPQDLAETIRRDGYAVAPDPISPDFTDENGATEVIPGSHLSGPAEVPPEPPKRLLGPEYAALMKRD